MDFNWNSPSFLELIEVVLTQSMTEEIYQHSNSIVLLECQCCMLVEEMGKLLQAISGDKFVIQNVFMAL